MIFFIFFSLSPYFGEVEIGDGEGNIEFIRAVRLKRPKRGKLLEAACPTQKVEKLLEAARPEGAEALSPGQRPGLFCGVSLSPCKGKSFKTRGNLQSFCPYRAPCRLALYPGRCPGLRASAPSGLAACVHNNLG